MPNFKDNSEVWECSSIAEKKSDAARDMSGQMTGQVINKSPIKTNLFGREKEGGRRNYCLKGWF